jgi:hypothetical protein
MCAEAAAMDLSTCLLNEAVDVLSVVVVVLVVSVVSVVSMVSMLSVLLSVFVVDVLPRNRSNRAAWPRASAICCSMEDRVRMPPLLET